MAELFDVTTIATGVTAIGTLAIAVVTALMVRATKQMAEVSNGSQRAVADFRQRAGLQNLQSLTIPHPPRP